MKKRKGTWMQTFTGRKVWPLDPRPEEIYIEDIAHALACVNRFGGHLPEPYSVAQHSLMVCFALPDSLKLCGLLHDATEAYLGDMVAPLKRHMPEFQRAEERLWLAIAQRFGLPSEMPQEVKEADLRALVAEAKYLMPFTVDAWDEDIWVEPFSRPSASGIFVHDWKTAEALFLAQYRHLMISKETP